jgi:uncharacterized protein YbgA (DUF1722 family)/uncharacterized protein YbbK (DUF523 family)
MMTQSDSQSSKSSTSEARPIVVVSQCLGFAAVRYDGQVLQEPFVKTLADHVRFVQICPEVGIGLGVPRDPIRIVVDHGNRRLLQPSTGRDLTELMEGFAQRFLTEVGPVDGFILKSRSPSCGIKDVKLFTADGGHPAGKSAGLFAEAVLHGFPHAAIEDEGRLTNFRLRHHFLTKLFLVARLREIRVRRAMADLVEFHTAYKLQLMAYSQSGLKALGQIVGNRDSLPPADVYQAYSQRLAQVIAEPSRPSANRNALMHAFGYVSKHLNGAEKQYFLDLLEEYRQERTQLSTLLGVLRAWVLRVNEPYLRGQRYFEPYPRVLLDLTDSGALQRR